jgi:XTP/dITP diphosphohydrolase
MRIIYGTTNSGKRKQVEDFLKATGVNDVEFLTLQDIGFTDEIIEDGLSLEENSMKKAKEIKKFCDKNNIKDIIVTDDTGLCVDCLNGEPGIYSGRYASKDMVHDASQEDNIKKLLENIHKTGDTNRTAKFVCVLTAILPNGEIKQVKGECLGKIAEKPGPMGKLTYGPVFIPEGFDRVMNDMKPEELGNTHREKAFLELLKII